VVATYDTGSQPVAVAVDTQRNLTYVVSRGSGNNCEVGALVTVLQ
jgi:hypothetical protein